MALTYTWEVTGIKKNADSKLVQTYWKKTGTDEHGHEGSFAGATPVDPAVADINVDGNLTEQEILDYIQTVVVDDYEAHVNAQIQGQIDAQHVEEVALPWAPAAEPEA